MLTKIRKQEGEALLWKIDTKGNHSYISVAKPRLREEQTLYLIVMETKVRVVAREIINGLKNADNTQSLITWLNAAKCLTAAADEKETKLPSALQHHSDVPLHQLQTLFREQHFGAVCSTILDLLSVEWVQKLPGNCFAEHVHVLFLTGPAADALLALDHAVQTHR